MENEWISLHIRFIAALLGFFAGIISRLSPLPSGRVHFAAAAVYLRLALVRALLCLS